MSHNDEHPETEYLPEGEDQDATTPDYEYYLDDNTLLTLQALKVENLPSNDVFNHEWVVITRYNDLYDETLRAYDQYAISERRYEKAFEQNQELRADNDMLIAENNKLNTDRRAEKNFAHDEQTRLAAKEKSLEDEARSKKNLLRGLGIATAVLGILTVALAISLINLRSQADSEGVRGETLNEQVRALKTSLDQEKEDHNKTREELQNVMTESQNRESLLKVSEQEAEEMQKDIDEKDKQLEEVNKEIEQLRQEVNDLNSSEVPTVTRTVVQQQPAPAPVTEYRTETVTADPTATTP